MDPKDYVMGLKLRYEPLYYSETPTMNHLTVVSRRKHVFLYGTVHDKISFNFHLVYVVIETKDKTIIS